jgi:hypothetical protein
MTFAPKIASPDEVF